MVRAGDSMRPGPMRRARSFIAAVLRRVWSALRWFLSAIGLRRETDPAYELALSRFKLDYTEFRQLLSANNSFLEEVADLETKLAGGEIFDLAYVKRKTVRAVADVHLMEKSLAAISQGRYPALAPALERVTEDLRRRLEEPPAAERAALCVDLGAIGRRDVASCGGKMANLGEVRNVVGLRTPDGFVVTTRAYRLFLEESDQAAHIAKEHLGLAGPADVPRVSEALRTTLLGAPLPVRLCKEVEVAAARLTGGEATARLAVRSSAVGEDSEHSFAGQFTTELNVTRDEVVAAYRQVLASLYAPGPMHYRLLAGLPGEHAAMAVGCLRMVDARTSGVCFSRDPSRPTASEVLIHAVAGLGVTLVDGQDSPEAFHVSRVSETPTIRWHPASVAERPGTARLLRDEEALELARQAMILEAHFGCPQDIEWALDGNRRVVILQSRPLRVVPEIQPLPAEPLSDAVPILRGGQAAYAGTGCGPAVHLDENDDLDGFPAGGVLVARRSSPKFVRVMDRASAIVTDAGSTTGHMASLARELRVPTLLNTGSATRDVPHGAIVTVDARAGVVYQGAVAGMGRHATDAQAESPRPMLGTRVHELLGRVAESITPLFLTDPRSPRFTPAECRTLHDLARFIHEKSFEEMFCMGERLGDVRGLSYHLDVFLPIDLYVIDLGDAVRPPDRGRKIKRSHVRSAPLGALLAGMLHEKIPRYGPRALDLRGLATIMARHAMSGPENDRTFRDPCYAIASDRYLNYTARVGYHFSVVDCYCGRTANKNYISFRFKGGAADVVRRSRRAQAIAEILRDRGFALDVKHDLVNARLNKASTAETLAHVETLGRLLQFVRQLDLAMVSDTSVSWVKEAFLAGNYSLDREPPE